MEIGKLDILLPCGDSCGEGIKDAFLCLETLQPTVVGDTFSLLR